MTELTSITPRRDDYVASNTGTAVLKIAIENRKHAREEAARGNRWVAKALRIEMRYYAQIAVRIARIHRASLSS